MIEVRALTRFNSDDLHRLVTGYRSPAMYRVVREESTERVTFTLELTPLAEPYVKRYDPLDAETLAHYAQVVTLGFSYAAYDGEICVGIALAEPSFWNRTLLVWELHVAEAYRGQGIGRRLIEALVAQARVHKLRALVCETQNTNVPAMQFYWRMGFHLEGIDLSYYTNEDYPGGEIAVFMKKGVA